jgi:hypothetical protein
MVSYPLLCLPNSSTHNRWCDLDLDKENIFVCRWWCSAADLFVAFILYRQHHQQAIIAHNPGLNNPDISKIIGEQWKAEGEETKKVWQELALVGGLSYPCSILVPDTVCRKRKPGITNNILTTVTNLVASESQARPH